MRDPQTRLALAGDVMLGRGIDQILPHPGDPTLHERYVTDARRYVEFAEQRNGPIPSPVAPAWPWGACLAALERAAPDVRIVNLETSVTRSDRFAAGKAVHYRMSPDNLDGLTAARPDVCTLANNHLLDLGREGLTETLDVLSAAGLASAGAGRDLEAAWRPAAVPVAGGGRVLVFSMGAPSSGIPPSWSATGDRSGVAALREPLADQAPMVLDRIRRWRREGDRVVASVHWGSNWGYEIDDDQVGFAHALIDGGVDVVHGHSSHHPRPIELHRHRPILYGCGDLINDYEGIAGHETYRADLRLLYLVDLDRRTGALAGLRMVPFQAHRLRLRSASPADTEWLCSVLAGTSHTSGQRIVREPDGHLALHGP